MTGSESELSTFRAELDEARTLLDFLHLTVDSLNSRARELEQAQSAEGPSAAASSDAWSVVTENFGYPSSVVDKEDHPARVALAKRIGQHFVRCLAGDLRAVTCAACTLCWRIIQVPSLLSPKSSRSSLV